VATAPLASFNVAVTLPVRGLPDGNALWPRVTATDAAAPAAVNETLVKQPLRVAAEAES